MRLLQASIIFATFSGVNGLAAANVPRRAFLASSMAAVLLPAAAADARYVLNEETGDYDEVEDPTWQEAWKGRIDKAQSMSSDEVFMAARGAGNLDLKDGEESAPSKKRRAMAACRDATLLEKAGVRDPKECTTRIMGEEVDFMLKVISSE
jgi:hypothetical protein